MSHERLVRLMEAYREARAAQPKARTTLESIRSILHALDVGEITHAQALRHLAYQATRLADEPTQAALYRHAAADIRQMLREEQ